jgi:hypothetical protein
VSAGDRQRGHLFVPSRPHVASGTPSDVSPRKGRVERYHRFRWQTSVVLSIDDQHLHLTKAVRVQLGL